MSAVNVSRVHKYKYRYRKEGGVLVYLGSMKDQFRQVQVMTAVNVVCRGDPVSLLDVALSARVITATKKAICQTGTMYAMNACKS